MRAESLPIEDCKCPECDRILIYTPMSVHLSREHGYILGPNNTAIKQKSSSLDGVDIGYLIGAAGSGAFAKINTCRGCEKYVGNLCPGNPMFEIGECKFYKGWL